MTENALIAAVFDNRTLMRDLGHRLWSLASSADALGQTRLADELSDIAEAMQVAAKRVVDAHHDEISGQLRESQQGTANILTALLAGVEMGKPVPTPQS